MTLITMNRTRIINKFITIVIVWREIGLKTSSNIWITKMKILMSHTISLDKKVPINSTNNLSSNSAILVHHLHQSDINWRISWMIQTILITSMMFDNNKRNFINIDFRTLVNFIMERIKKHDNMYVCIKTNNYCIKEFD